jgi:glycosyltransferase involved in cell wall biosynthesis
MKIAIVIPTYYRKDGNTSKYLTRALDSVFNQTYQNFKIFLMGDKYENEIEVLEILKKYDGKKIFFTNLLEAKERDNYLIPRAIWLYGGVNATNIGIEMALNEGYEYICHLDHDDW